MHCTLWKLGKLTMLINMKGLSYKLKSLSQTLGHILGDNAMKLRIEDLSEFTAAYVEAIFFTNEEQGDFSDFALETVDKVVKDCAAFELSNLALLREAGSPEQNGHDFWLTRNHEGAGFWDRGYTQETGDALTKAAQQFPELHLVQGDDGLLYLEG